MLWGGAGPLEPALPWTHLGELAIAKPLDPPHAGHGLALGGDLPRYHHGRPPGEALDLSPHEVPYSKLLPILEDKPHEGILMRQTTWAKENSCPPHWPQWQLPQGPTWLGLPSSVRETSSEHYLPTSNISWLKNCKWEWLKNKGQWALARQLSWCQYTKAEGSISDQGTYKPQPMNAQIHRTNRCFSQRKSMFLSLNLKSIFKIF